ncbi:MAG: ABC transporter permease subunit, partial [Verrucomicrobia bacterium]|nr:ABC transporter permease subunit [Verrucomicrobiota bacterium]
MNALPVITRELRAQSRNRRNVWLRLAGAGAAMSIFALFVGKRAFDLNDAAGGAKLFVTLHTTMLAAIWLLVPALTADCIAQEKREGTLGLLFLTPLTAREIVAGKCFVHALRALTLWLAAFPALTIPFLIGGVGWLDLVTAGVLQLCSLALALAAGLLASSRATQWVSALALAGALALGLAAVLAVAFYYIFGLEAADFVPWEELELQALLENIANLVLGADFSGSEAGWSDLMAGWPAGVQAAWLRALGETAFLTALIALWIV